MTSKNLDESAGLSHGTSLPVAPEPSTEKQLPAESGPLPPSESKEPATQPELATSPGTDKEPASKSSPATMSSGCPSESAHSRRRRLSSKVVLVAPRSDSALIPATARGERHRARRRSSTERLHEASHQALATSGAERYLNLWLFIGVSSGVVAGLTLMYVAFPGDMLLRMLQLCVMPLITSSIVAAIGGVDLRLAGRLGRRAFIYYMATTVIAEIEGLALVFLIRPGVHSSVDLAKAPPKRIFYLADAIMDIVRNMIPPNIVEAALYSWSTKAIIPVPPDDNSSNITEEEPEFVVERAQGTNVLGLLVFAVFVGAIIASTGERNRPMHDLVVSITDIMMSLIRIIMWYCPAGVGFLIAHRILATGDLGRVLSQLGLYVVTVLTGLAVHMFFVLTAVYLLFVRRGLGSFARAMITPALMAISTSSSSATIPVTIATLEDRLMLDPRVVRFMVPVGATVNMDGAALYEAVSAVFLAQLHGVDMDIGRVLAVSLTATVASVGAAGIPGGGLVTMVIVLQAVGLPAEDIGLIATVDWFLDRFRTVVNVMGDCVGTAVVHHLSQADLKVTAHSEDEDGMSLAIRPKAFV
ncbi:excitatory amino acid transporter 3-like isoform X2 [Dermacentor albipictus]|uniref:excitatory amino acid transporter 3-like isoform X2 n=1 Tax=Dermacentor albipictus TaxID=60249 RepID=UPI0031FC67F6